VISQLVPEERTDGQVPRPPFDGAFTTHEAGVQVCAVRTPFVQLVTGPLRTYPEAHWNWQLFPEGRVVWQVPRNPFAGAVTGQELCACAQTGMPSRAAVSQRIIVVLIAFSARPPGSSHHRLPFKAASALATLSPVASVASIV
jgi:hypothetical protein